MEREREEGVQMKAFKMYQKLGHMKKRRGEKGEKEKDTKEEGRRVRVRERENRGRREREKYLVQQVQSFRCFNNIIMFFRQANHLSNCQCCHSSIRT